jgi:hypothetical protein
MAAGRAVLEEIIMVDNDGIAPVTLATVSCTLSTALLLAILVIAQLLPGLDHGVQVSSRAAALSVQVSESKRPSPSHLTAGETQG